METDCVLSKVQNTFFFLNPDEALSSTRSGKYFLTFSPSSRACSNCSQIQNCCGILLSVCQY